MIRQEECEVSAADFVRQYVDLARVGESCARCPNCGKNWSCPPYAFSVPDYWAQFSRLRLFVREVDTPEELRQQTFSREELNALSRRLLREAKFALLQDTFALEKQLPGSVSLAAGSCEFCPDGQCARLRGLPCIHPETLRYSLESLGGDVCAALEGCFGKSILWAKAGHLPEHFTLVGGLLIP